MDPTLRVTHYISYDHNHAIVVWCKANIGKLWHNWDYDIRLIGELLVCKFNIVSAAHRLLFDIQWSDLDIYHSSPHCYRHYIQIQRRTAERAQQRWEC